MSNFNARKEPTKKTTFKQRWEDIKTFGQGVKFYGNILKELITGTSAAGVLFMAGLYAREHAGNKAQYYIMAFAVILMLLIALGVLGKFVLGRGKRMES